MTLSVKEHPEVSVTVIEYEPEDKLSMYALLSPFDH